MFHPLQEDIIEELTYSDGAPFDPDVDYKLGAKKIRGECLYLRQTENFETMDSNCDKEKTFICQWTAPPCPEFYSYVGQVSNGGTCHAVLEASDFFSASCDSNTDFLRSRYTPKDTIEITRLRQHFQSQEPYWTGSSMDHVGDWYLNNASMITDDFSDLRRPIAETWVPPDTVLNVTGSTSGCLEVTKSGLLHAKIDQDCDMEQKPTCQYKHCMTHQGKPCLFPFVYDNETHPILTFTICSGLDVYRPWCPTKLGENLNVLEWGDCLEDCPSESINSACLNDPRFPLAADGMDAAVNYTHNYTRGISVVTDEFDYVAFTCPDGYVYEGTNNKTHYAVCMHWEFIYLYDEDALCVRKYLPSSSFY